MVDEITLFELHLDDARFGTNDTVATDQSVSDADTETSGPSVAKLVLASLFLSIAVTVLVRRLVGDDTEDADESDDPIEVEIET
ncbi:MAG: hypothetical protein ACOCP2_03685 [Halohasta sp.]